MPERYCKSLLYAHIAVLDVITVQAVPTWVMAPPAAQEATAGPGGTYVAGGGAVGGYKFH